jgi:hypothetical protein
VRPFSLLLGAALALLPSSGRSHGIEHPRRLTLAVLPTAPRAVRLTVALAISANELEGLKRTFDRNRDKLWSADERRVLEQFLEKRATAGLRLTCGDAPLSWTPWRLSIPEIEVKKDIVAQVEAQAVLPGGDCVLQDGGDRTGHLPMVIVGADAVIDAPKGATPGTWDIPAKRGVKVSVKGP